MILSATVGLYVGAAMVASVGLAARWLRAVPLLPDFPFGDGPRPILEGMTVNPVQAPELTALRLVEVTDAAGREWLIPADRIPCGVCASIGGHLPQCPAAES